MTQPAKTTSSSPTVADWAARALFFLLMVLVTFNPPLEPSVDLDASWRMALGRFFHDGLQFGVDVVFTYGPLGFLMGKTYTGDYFTTFIVWQIAQALIFTLLIFRVCLRLEGYPRYFYFAFFLLLGVTYEDSLHQQAIALAGFELLRTREDEGRWTPALLGFLLGFLGLFKFTNLMLGAVVVGCVLGLQFWHRRPRAALWPAAWFAGTFLVGWVLCRQNPLHLPAYLRNSWEISQGYQETMGIPTPPDALRIGLVTAALIGAYTLLYLFTAADRARAVATTLMLAAFLFLNWKHGFVRADGHMIGFFYAVLLPATAFPVLLNDGPRFRLLQRLLLIVAALYALVGLSTALPGVVRGCIGNMQERLANNLDRLGNPNEFYRRYERVLAAERTKFDLPETRAVVGADSIDLLGYEQAIVLYNRLNYRPRPVFQSYSVYRPALARLNAKFFASDRAPQYVLLKLFTIDRRLVTFDDSEVLSLLVHRYEYVHSEKGYMLWRRKPGPFSLATITPQPLHSATLVPGQPFMAEDWAKGPLWATVEVRPSILGRLRALLYKLPIVLLRVQDTHGLTTEYRMPLPQGKTGFIINPIVEDGVSYMRFAGGKPERVLRSLTLVVSPEDKPYFMDEYTVSLSTLPPSTAGREFFLQAQKRLFHMFNITPASYEAQTPISEGEIDGKPVMVFHAPSELTIQVPKDAKEFTGLFGYMAGAYTNGGNTDGADFTITWIRNAEEVPLLNRHLDPVNQLEDRKLQSFRVELPPGGGKLVLRTLPGPRNNLSWDWTAWTGLTLR